MTRGERNCNPGNIRLGASWQGLCANQTDPAFCQFTDVSWGVRAIGHILHSYEREGCHTVRAIIDRWAPPVENDTGAYVADVAAHCGVDPDQPIKVDDILTALVAAIIKHENGEQPYALTDIATWARMS